MSLSAARAGSRSRGGSRRFPRVVQILAALVILAATSAVFANRFLEVYRLGREAARLEGTKRNLQEQNAILREEAKLLQTPGYVEKIAREQLGLVKPDEIAVLIVRPPAAVAPKAAVPRPRSPWQALWDRLRR